MKNQFRNWSDIRVFLAVCRAGSTLAASRDLDMSQPTVARRIDVLEHETGLILFDRETRGFRPTEAGRALIPVAEALEAAARNVEAKAEDLRDVRPIRVTAYSANLSPPIMQIFSDFTAMNPTIDFEFLPTLRTLDLLGGEADIGIRIMREPAEPDLICRRVSTAQFALFASHGYVAEHGRPTSLDTLGGHKFIGLDPRNQRYSFNDWMVAHVPGQIVQTYAEADLMHAAMKSGLGMAIDNVRRCSGDPDLVQCSDPIPEFSAEHVILISPEAWRRPEVKEFVKFFAPRYTAFFR